MNRPTISSVGPNPNSREATNDAPWVGEEALI